MAFIIVQQAYCMKLKSLKHEYPLRRGELLVSGVAVQEEMPPGIVDRPHGTGDRMLMYFYQETEMKVADDVFLFPARTLRLWAEGAGHYYGNRNGKWVHSWLHFHGSAVGGILKSAGLADDFHITFEASDLLEEYLFLIYRESVLEKSPSPKILRNHISNLFLEIARHDRTPADDQIPEKWLELRLYIENNPAAPLDLKKFSRMACLSVPAVCAGFQRHFGTSPIRFQLDCRMELARYLLRNKNLSVKEVAERCGYSDPFQFSRMFKRRTGIAPRDSR